MDPIQGVRVLCIGAGIEQTPVIHQASRMGLHVIAVDGNPHAVGLGAAHRSRVIDLRDAGAVIRFAREADPRLLLPVTLGAVLTTVGAVNDALALPGISAAAARKCTDKGTTHDVFVNAGIPVPRQAQAASELDIAAVAAGTIGFPAVLKPRFGSGSRGIVVARSIAELREWLPWHLAQRDQGASSPGTLVEEFIAGLEVGVDGVVLGRRYSTLLIRDKEVTDLPFRLPYGFLTPTSLTSDQQARVNATMAAAVEALALTDCLVHADVILASDGRVHVVDVSGRPSGFGISTRMIPAAIGVDPIHQLTRQNLGCSSSFQPLFRRAAVLRMLSAPAGRILAVEGVKEARRMQGVAAVETFLERGDEVQERRTGTAYSVGYLLTAAETLDDAKRLWQEAAAAIHFRVIEHATP